MAETASETVSEQPGSLSAGIVTTPMLDEREPCLRVSALRWDSGFRGSGLQVGDRIVAVEGVAVSRPVDMRERQKQTPRLLGQYAEPTVWAEAGRQAGDGLRIRVRRRQIPGQGWGEHEIAGTLQPQRTWVNDTGRQLFGSGGPDRMGNDGLSENWSSWYEKAAAVWQRTFDGLWQGSGFNNRYELKQQLQDEPRIRLLLEKYPGAFASAVAADWQAACDSLRGGEYVLAADTLDYRKLGEQRVQQIAQAAVTARAAYVAANQAQMMAPFPAIDPVMGDRDSVAGKLVDLPRISHREWISQGTRTVFVFGQGDQWYFADGASKPIERMIRAQRRYESGVTPNIRSDYAVIARVLAEPMLVVNQGRGCFGLRVEPVAASIGDALFVDLDPAQADPPLFAGEAELALQALAPPPDDASPQTVMECFHTALKLGDRNLWRSLFADWSLRFADNGLPLVEHGRSPDVDSWWDSGRRLILGEVLDVRVIWTGDIVPMVQGQEFDNAPKIDETQVEVDHIGQEEGSPTRVFSKVGLRRLWTLQRVDGGPWRIVSQGGI